MRLMINYKGISKIMPEVESYDDIVKFVHENFFLKMSKWTMSYIDSDGDPISLDSDLDVKTMLETTDRAHVKVFIKDVEGESVLTEEKNIGQEFHVEEDEKVENKIEQPEVIKVQNIPAKQEEAPKTEVPKIEEKMQEIPSNQNWDKCGGRGMWKKNIEEKMAKFVDERVEALIPLITKKVQQRLQNKEVKPEPVNSVGLNHGVKCNTCGIEAIIGIRYKCVKCPSFNICQKCQETIGHKHNMIKMKFLEEPEEEPKEWFGKPWWKRHHQGMPHPPPFMPPSMNPQMNPCQPGNMPPSKFGFPMYPPQFGRPPCSPVAGFLIPNHNLKDQKSESCDPRLKTTKKCFRMSNMFGGSPKDYEEFVTKNIDLKIEELSQLYVTMNQSAKISNEVNDKVEQRAQKLAFYFKETPEKYIQLVKKNPASNLKQLIKLVNQKPQSQIPQPSQKPQQKSKCPENIQMPSVPILPVVPSLPPMPMPLKKLPIDIKKRNKCVLELKQLFGDEKVFEYIEFFNDNSEKEIEEIMDMYIKKINKQKIQEPVQKIQMPNILPVVPPVPPMPMPMKKLPIDVKKRNKCVLEMKELFGDEKVFDYIEFFNDNSEKEIEEIVEMYIKKISK